jgi:formamidopyrimidine-DNA glycosylase
MPELPDIEAYCTALRPRIANLSLLELQVANPFFLRSLEPGPEETVGRRVGEITRLGKRIVIELVNPDHPTQADDHLEPLFLVMHLMIAGRLRWSQPKAKLPGKLGLAALRFEQGSLMITEAGTQRRASLHIVAGRFALAGHNPGGLEPLEIDIATFITELRRENRTLKRFLTDPRRLAGIGNAFSDEILHAAKLSPVARTRSLKDDAAIRLYEATQAVLRDWSQRLSERYIKKFPGPGEVTAFRPEFTVHGKYMQPCQDCGAPVQRIRYADNETNYCPGCQTGGRILADRSLSRLLKDDWPRSIDTWEHDLNR